MVLVYAADAITTRLALFVQNRIVLNYNIELPVGVRGVWLTSIGLLAFIAIGYLFIWEDLRPRHIGIRFRPLLTFVRNFAIGCAVGAVVMSVVVIGSSLLGGYSIAENFQQVRVGSVILMALIYVFQSFGEEVLYRGAGLMCLSRKSSPVVALVVTSAIFALHHFQNNGYGPIAFVNLFLLAMLCGMSVFATNRIWMATAIHAAWNFFQGSVFGVNVSGHSDGASARLFSSTANGMPLITGGQMGLEGGLVTTVVLLVAVGIFAWRISVKPVEAQPRPARGRHMARASEE